MNRTAPPGAYLIVDYEDRVLVDGKYYVFYVKTRIPQIDCNFADPGRGFWYENQYLVASVGALSWRTQWVKRI